MAHFAQIDEDNIVIQIIVVADKDCGGGQYPESDPIGAAFCNNLLGGTWKQTSYNTNGGEYYDPETGERSADQSKAFRKNYAGIGFKYDAERDAFIPPKPFNSWVLDEDTCYWDPPVELPEDSGTGDPPKLYQWDEETISWVVVEAE